MALMDTKYEFMDCTVTKSRDIFAKKQSDAFLDSGKRRMGGSIFMCLPMITVTTQAWQMTSSSSQCLSFRNHTYLAAKVDSV